MPTPRRARASDVMPLAYFGAAIALIAVLLPTALRPPPQQPPTSTEFSPDVPPEDSEVLITELARGRSSTAGAGVDAPVGVGGDSGLPSVDFRPRKGRCFGDPPRQTESLYSAACAAAWVGDNGGATYKGVSVNEVRLAWWHTLGNNQASYEGPVPATPRNNENAQDRTLRVYQAWFNKTFETYGRRVQLYSLKPGSGEENQRARATMADEEFKIFAGTGVGQGLCDELARRKLVNWCGQKPEEWFAEEAPYNWSWYMDLHMAGRFAAEYVCKKLVGRNARFAGDPSMHGQKRVLGYVYYDDADNGSAGRDHIKRLREQCGASYDEVATFNLTDTQGQSGYGTAVAKLRAAGVTTVTLGIDFLSAVVLTNAADNQKYYPEWFVPGIGANDRNQLGQLMNPVAWRSAFGFSGAEMEIPLAQMDCYRAYKEIDPEGEPHYGICTWFFPSMLQVLNGIQNAGPRLTPQTFQRGMFDYGYRFYDDPVWAIGGGYGPGDWTYMDNVVEIWWDPVANDPQADRPGTYRYVRCGKRYRLGELPREEALVFSDGVTGDNLCKS